VFSLPTYWPGSRQHLLQTSLLNIDDADTLGDGQPDPTDASHFTIACQRHGESKIIDGWMMPDDTIKLELRRAPASQR
jgi:hypothetical protein